MKVKDNTKKYPAIQKEMEELRLKCSKQEEECQRMKELQSRMEVEEKELDDLLEIVRREIEEEERRKDDIMEEEEAIDELEGVIAQNSQKISNLLEEIEAEKTIKQQWQAQDLQNKHILQQLSTYITKAERLVQIQQIMKKKKLLWQQLWK